ncbi:MAG: cation transporter, partial [Myxococcales bacterium]|nr:cation transporter [Myxococcales bacterium]
EAAVGLWTGSLALLSDAGHMLGDVAALLLAFAVAGLTRRPATPTRTFGLARAEALGAFVNGAALLVICGVIFREAIGRLLGGPPDVPGWPVLWVGLIGLLINLGSAWALWRSASSDLNVRGALAHMLADALGSLGAMVSAGLVLGFGWQAADPIVALLIGALVLWGAVHVVLAASRVLLDFAPAGLSADRVEQTLLAVEGVGAAHDVHVWGHGGRVMVTAHLVPATGVRAVEVLHRAQAQLREAGVGHSTLQVEPADGCPQPGCPFADCGSEAPDHEHDHGHGHDHPHAH